MARTIRTLTMVLAACVLVALPARVWAQRAVQVVAGDAKVYLSADAASTVITPVPVGAMLTVVSKAGNWYQVQLPKDGSGFDRVGFIEKSKIKEIAGAATPASAPSSATSQASGRTGRPTAAVLNFEFSAVQSQWGNWDIGKGVADMMVEELLQTGALRMLERKQIEAVLGEQDFSNGNRADVSAKDAAQLAKVLGAKILITGTVTKFGSETKNVGGGAGAAIGSHFGMGGTGVQNSTANVAITVRAIDASTSEILASVKGEGKSSRKGLLLGAGFDNNYGAINMTSSDFQDTILGEASEKAVTDAATRLTSQLMNALK